MDSGSQRLTSSLAEFRDSFRLFQMKSRNMFWFSSASVITLVIIYLCGDWFFEQKDRSSESIPLEIVRGVSSAVLSYNLDPLSSEGGKYVIYISIKPNTDWDQIRHSLPQVPNVTFAEGEKITGEQKLRDAQNAAPDSFVRLFIIRITNWTSTRVRLEVSVVASPVGQTVMEYQLERHGGKWIVSSHKIVTVV